MWFSALVKEVVCEVVKFSIVDNVWAPKR